MMRRIAPLESMTRRFVRRHQLDAFLSATSRLSASRLFERHQKSERGIFELQVPQDIPVPLHVGLQIIENVAETDDAAGRDGGAGRKRSERDQTGDDPAG